MFEVLYANADASEVYGVNEYDTLKAARQEFENPEHYYRNSELFILQGPGVYEERRNSKKAERDDEWRREQAMEAGMLHGAEAYNDAMGY